MNLTGILSLLLAAFFTVLPFATTQETAARVPLPDECDETANLAKIKLFLKGIDEEISKLSANYPQLKDWDKPQDSNRNHEGKRISDTELVYYHAFRRVKSSDYRDWYGENGCQVHVRINTECQMRRLSGPGIKTKLFGLKMGDRYIIATVITEKPEVVELEKKITDIIRAQAQETGKNWTR